MNFQRLVFSLLFAITNSFCNGQSPQYLESNVPPYELPELLTSQNGETITTSSEWVDLRRSEIYQQFEELVYGQVPTHKIQTSFKVSDLDKNALGGIAVRKEITITFQANGKQLEATLLVYLPKTVRGPVPVFLGYNFYGNHTIIGDPGISLPSSWLRNNATFGITENKATELSRGVRASRWPVLYILSRGYGLANIYYGDIDPDFDDEFKNGLHRLIENSPKTAEWGSIATWAWALSRALDYFESDKDIDHQKVAVIGHSRLGKTSLWAGASDQRFALVISNDSGCGGAALSKRKFGETVKVINDRFPHWFCDNFTRFNDQEETLPIDQHMLIALMAPRPVYVASASEDQWADPRGEFLAAREAGKVYRLFNKQGLLSKELPKVNAPDNQGAIGYHLRSGSHDLTYYDWKQYLDFADRHLRN